MRKRYLGFITTLLLLILGAPGALPAQVTLELALDRDQAALTDAVVLTLTISGTAHGASEPLIAGLEDFRVSSGGSSTRVSIVNGRKSSEIGYTYYLQPRTQGDFTLGPARVKIRGQEYTSNRVRLKVTPPPAASVAGQGPLLLLAALSAETAYVEQPLVYTLRLYRQIRVSDLTVDLPELEGIRFRQLGEAREYVGTIGSERYQVLEVRYLLETARAGDFTLPPATMHMSAYESSRFRSDPFFGLGRGRPVSVTSKALALQVRPLPEEGQPADFSGLVGSFELTSTLEPLALTAGESASLSVRVAGRGNVQRIPDLSLPALEGLKVYADQPALETTLGPEGMRGVKTMKWALVPQQAGSYTIPPLRLTYFDPVSGTYVTLATEGRALEVLPGAQPAAAPPTATAPEGRDARQAVEELGHDILPAHTATQNLHPGLSLATHRQLALGLVLVPALAWLGLLLLLHLRQQGARQADARRARKALKVFRQTCRQGAPGPAETLEALRTYLNARLGLCLGLITPHEVQALLTARGVSPAHGQALGGAIERLQQRLYSGAPGGEQGAAGADLLALIRRIDREVRP